MNAVGCARDVVDLLSVPPSLPDLANISSPMRPIADKVGEPGALAGPVQRLGEAPGEIHS